MRRADLLRRLGRTAEAALAYEAAIARTDNTDERDFLQRRREAVVSGSLGSAEHLHAD